MRPSPTSSGHEEFPAAIFLRFLKFGCLAWGGPAAQIAMVKRECVDEEMWISEARERSAIQCRLARQWR
jgi:chromate transporter